MIEHVIAQAVDAWLSPVIVVVGAEAQAIRHVVAMLPVEIAPNENWKSGMGSSISTGIRHLQQIAPDVVAVAILLSDQPLVKAMHLIAMRELLRDSATNIVAAEYNRTLGVPAFFKHELFADLAALAPDIGARRILRGPGAHVSPYPLPEAAIDIDTPEDFAALNSRSEDV